MMVARDGVEPPTPAFSATLCCTFNDLTDSRWPPKSLRSRKRHANRGLESWVQSQPRNQAYFTVTGRLKLSSWTSRHSYSSCSWHREDLRLQGSTGPKTGGYQSKKATNRELIVVATMILRMIGTPVFSDRTEFSVTTGEDWHSGLGSRGARAA